VIANHQQQFLEFAISMNVLKFGEFKLKSGRVSPYFFNAGLFNNGEALARLGQFYSVALLESGVEFDLLFGPAYKGIPLVSTTAVSLHTDHGINVRYGYNRKEVKDHGEGGQLVGAQLQGKVVIVDDVITAGTAVREVMALLQSDDSQATPVQVTGVLIAMDRQERGKEDRSAIQEVESEYGISAISVVKLEHIIDYLALDGRFREELDSMNRYRDQYGAV
jgi:orotate phosphoribosyltransferase